MANIFDDSFIDVAVPVLRRIKGAIPFDIYVRRASDTYTKLFPKDENIDPQRLDHYQFEKDVVAFYVQRDAYNRYLMYVERVAEHLFKNPKEATADELVTMVKEMTSMTIFEIEAELKVDQESVQHAAVTVAGALDVLEKEPKALGKIFNQLAQHPFQVKHAITTSIFSLLLGKKEKLGSKKTLLTLGLGGLLHDIGMSRLPFNPEEKGELSAEEWKQVKEHPEVGKRMLDWVKTVSPEVRMIVLQHHEQPNGQGYPNGMRGPSIYYPAKIVAIADTFSALISPREFRDDRCTPLQAIELMREDVGKYDNRLLTQFAALFVNVKPGAN